MSPMLVTVWESDPKGRASYQSPSWHEYVGDQPGGSLGEDWLRFCHPEDRQMLLAEWRKAVESGGEHLYDIEVRIRRHDGEYRWFRVSGHPIREPDGSVSKWIGTCKEVARAAQPRLFNPLDVRRAAGIAQSILVVDDNPDAVTAFALLLRQLGHQVEEAHDGVTALALARRLRPTVMFLDLNMPRMGGHEVARALRADPAFSRTLIVAVSGFGQPNDVAAARAAGFDHYIVKPYDIEFVKSLLGPRISQPVGS
ncbi:MAG TPA: response regulator [Burkholderiales bacterium]|nr:response regulator [Burkholderiales bacterium]